MSILARNKHSDGGTYGNKGGMIIVPIGGANASERRALVQKFIKLLREFPKEDKKVCKC